MRAIVYHAYCRPEYVEMAVISAESAKQHMPDVETVLLTEMAVDGGFDRVVQVNPVPLALANFAPLLKLPADYDSIVYFDCDSYICAPFYDVFELVESDRVDMALVATRHRDKGSESYVYPGAKGVPIAYPDLRGTPVAFQNNTKTQKFFVLWSRLFHKHQRKYHATSPWAKGCFQRQPSMRDALYHSDLSVVTLSTKYYVVSSAVVQGKVRSFDTSKSKNRKALAITAKAMNRYSSELRLLSGGRGCPLKDIQLRSVSDLASVSFFEGMKFYYPPGGAADYFVDGSDDVTGFEPEVTRYLRAALQKDMVFLDIGAHFGYYTLLAANRARTVISFEPKAAERAVLLENIECNRLENVTVMEKPLFSGAVRGYIRKCRFRPNSNGDLEAVTLDSLCLSPDAVKIDVEGAELDVLMGAKKTLRAHKPILVVEIHTHKIRTFGHRWTQVSDFLRYLGYTVTSLGERRAARFIRAEYVR